MNGLVQRRVGGEFFFTFVIRRKLRNDFGRLLWLSLLSWRCLFSDCATKVSSYMCMCVCVCERERERERERKRERGERERGRERKRNRDKQTHGQKKTKKDRREKLAPLFSMASNSISSCTMRGGSIPNLASNFATA